MARVLGIGGVFFKCKDKSALIDWYHQHLGMEVNELGGIEFDFRSAPADSYCVWGPFAEATKYFSPSRKPFMLNLIVDELEPILATAKAGGARILGEIEETAWGRFAWFMDPEDNKIELWQPDSK